MKGWGSFEDRKQKAIWQAGGVSKQQDNKIETKQMIGLQSSQTTPFSNSHLGEVRAQTARPPPRPRATAIVSSIYTKRKKGSLGPALKVL